VFIVIAKQGGPNSLNFETNYQQTWLIRGLCSLGKGNLVKRVVKEVKPERDKRLYHGLASFFFFLYFENKIRVLVCITNISR